MLRSTPFTERFTEEVKNFHKWLGVIFYYSDSFPRVLRIISLSTNVLAMLFVQSITYNLTNPDDGSCELHSTKTECLTEMSPFGTGDPKCFWDHGFKRGSCHFNQPVNNLKIVLFVAIFAAIISTPIALSADWVIMNVLAAQTSKRKNVVSLTKSQKLSVVPSSSVKTESVSVQPFRLTRRTAAFAAESSASTRETAVTQRRRYSVARFLGLESNQALLHTTLQEDLSSLLRGLCGYRETLLHETQRKEFNGELMFYLC
jgi:hypothetical protein